MSATGANYAAPRDDLVRAILAKDMAAATTALGRGADPDARASNGATCLMLAIQLQLDDIVEMLLEAGADVNARAMNGGTVLYAAAAYASAGAVTALVERGADVNAVSGGVTPLFIAAQLNRTAVVRALLAAHADPGIKAENGATALMQAVKNGNGEMVRDLIRHGASTTAEARGWTALKIAKNRGHTGIVRILEQAGQ